MTLKCIWWWWSCYENLEILFWKSRNHILEISKSYSGNLEILNVIQKACEFIITAGRTIDTYVTNRFTFLDVTMFLFGPLYIYIYIGRERGDRERERKRWRGDFFSKSMKKVMSSRRNRCSSNTKRSYPI